MTHAKSLRGGLPGARNAVMVLPALVSGNVQPSVARWAAEDAQMPGTSLIARPVAVQTSAPGTTRVALYSGGVVWGGMFPRHDLERRCCTTPDIRTADSRHSRT
ncbi:hypothetical protein OHS59_42330 [Streptomyces sp. NBC_00414]|uniref:hypothetical protein n=1 Tax=Streptomyces sp. NBC_00414 TaxID=2975739 RepID=UPI002E24940A